MNRIAGWWIGATVVPTRLELWSLAEMAGGWSALEACGLAELVALGVEPEAARRWVEMPDGASRGVPVTRADPRYPAALQPGEQSPPVLYFQGNLDRLAEPAVAVVGTRRCSGRGSTLARHIGRELAGARVVVVSGLARGIDTAAHAGALTVGGGRTIAVLGHGLSHQSPAGNRRLREQIVADGGLVMAGWPDAVPADKWTFPARNRWVAGLSRATVFVEGPERSGAGITARDTLEQGSDVWVVPGVVGDPASGGPMHLLARQIAEDLEHRDVLAMRLQEATDALEADERLSPLRRSALRAALQPSGRGRVRLLREVDAFVEEVTGRSGVQEEAWLHQILSGATVEQVAREWQESVLALQAALTQRELRGELVRLPGGRYARAQ